MKTITFYVVAAICLLATKLNAQSFEDRVNTISNNIEKITKEQKDSLKMEVAEVNKLLEDNQISADEADRRKKELSEKRADIIETQVAAEQEKLNQVVKDKVDGKIAMNHSGKISLTFPSKDKNYNEGEEKDTTNVECYSYKRTTSQFVYALGVNRVVEDNKINNDDYKWRSDFYEVGVAFNTRLFENNNLLHAKYGLSLQYNNLRPNDNKIFQKQGGQTELVTYEDNDLDVSRFRYVNLVVPVHLEFDFAPKKVNGDKTYFPVQEGFRLGVGGYAGVNVKEKQILKYKDDNDNKVKEKTKGDFNVSDFVYGVSAYVGYKSVSLYAKYDLQPVFQNNAIDQNNLSLGIRFDFN